MQEGLLPLFPLEMVLFPRAFLPLHIFEDRYKEMIGEALAGGTEFGVVLAKQNGILNMGCTAVVDKVVERYSDGRLDILALGKRRFEILLVNEEKTYLRGAVQFFDDDEVPPAPGELQNKLVAAARTLSDLEDVSPPEDLSAADPQLSFRVADLVSDLNFRQELLRSRSERERAERLSGFLEQFIPRRRWIAAIRRAAPTNGHGHLSLKA